MPNLRCPKCGLENSSEEEVCSFCNAKLKPTPIDLKASASGADIPDWLQSLRNSEDTTTPVSSQEEPLPDWLDSLSGQSSETPVGEETEKEDRAIGSSTEAADKEGVTPDWFRDLFSDVKFSDELGVEESANDELKGEEDQWLSRIDENVAESNNQLSEILEGSSELGLISPQVEPTVESEIFFQEVKKMDVFEEGFREGIPDTEMVEGSITEVNEEESAEELGWLDELEAAMSGFHPDKDLPISEDTTKPLEAIEQKSGDLTTIPDEVLPSWLSEVASEDEPLEIAAGEKEEDTGLMPAELPSWLQAMRPIEATSVGVEVSTGVELEKAEVAGPLAGLRGALPAEPDISQMQKPSAYSVKLQVTEIQQSQASLLEGMIHSEGETLPAPVRPVITSQHVLRILIAIILFFSVLIPMVTGIPQAGLPVNIPGISPSIQSIGGLSAGAPVLLAIDYAPGFSGEMEAISATVVDHLMRQGVYLAVVSTTPTGPTQAERLITSVNQEGNHGYGSPDQYVNLGFIPGGPAGLLQFSGAPRQVLPYDILGKSAWSSQPISNIEAISGFSMVVVATENPDTARSWIEQVRPKMKDIPLILVVSSQAEPLLRPYFEAVPQQIQGLVGGLAGGVSYQTQTDKYGNASYYWPSFSLSMMFAGLLIVIGGLVNLALAYSERRKESARKEG